MKYNQENINLISVKEVRYVLMVRIIFTKEASKKGF